MNPRCISFAWTTDAFLANVKDMTRRYWKDSYAKSIQHLQFMIAMDKMPYAHGKPIGQIIVHEKYQQRTSQLTELDYEREGLLWMEKNNLKIKGQHPREFFDEWKKKDDLVWVLEFSKTKDETGRWLNDWVRKVE
ncbi:MAG: hypothetical protein IMZ58_07635 [Thermoplasmata archaeon]|nr:hypothetical protein [Thermoplasmata archaeon]